jgi:hypothetical protein
LHQSGAVTREVLTLLADQRAQVEAPCFPTLWKEEPEMIVRVLVYSLLTALIVVLLGGASEAVALPIAISLPQLAPGIAGMLMLLIFRRAGLRIALFKRGIPPARYLGARRMNLDQGFILAWSRLRDRFEVKNIGRVPPDARGTLPPAGLGAAVDTLKPLTISRIPMKISFTMIGSAKISATLRSNSKVSENRLNANTRATAARPQTAMKRGSSLAWYSDV